MTCLPFHFSRAVSSCSRRLFTDVGSYIVKARPQPYAAAHACPRTLTMPDLSAIPVLIAIAEWMVSHIAAYLGRVHDPLALSFPGSGASGNRAPIISHASRKRVPVVMTHTLHESKVLLLSEAPIAKQHAFFGDGVNNVGRAATIGEFAVGARLSVSR